MSKYKADLKIDPFDLNTEILQQPQKYYEWGYQCGLAEADRDDAKDDLDIIRGEIDAKARSKHKNAKEGFIKSQVDNHPKVIIARKKYIQARRNHTLLKRAEEAFRQRKTMIQTYVYRETNNMNSDVKVPRPYDKAMHEDFSDEIRNHLNEDMPIKKTKRRY